MKIGLVPSLTVGVLEDDRALQRHDRIFRRLNMREIQTRYI